MTARASMGSAILFVLCGCAHALSLDELEAASNAVLEASRVAPPSQAKLLQRASSKLKLATRLMAADAGEAATWLAEQARIDAELCSAEATAAMTAAPLPGIAMQEAKLPLAPDLLFAPRRNLRLLEARALFDGLNPDVLRLAPREVQVAGEQLEQAEEAWASLQDPAFVDHLAYLVQQRTRIAAAIARRLAAGSGTGLQRRAALAP